MTHSSVLLCNYDIMCENTSKKILLHKKQPSWKFNFVTSVKWYRHHRSISSIISLKKTNCNENKCSRVSQTEKCDTGTSEVFLLTGDAFLWIEKCAFFWFDFWWFTCCTKRQRPIAKGDAATTIPVQFDKCFFGEKDYQELDIAWRTSSGAKNILNRVLWFQNTNR